MELLHTAEEGGRVITYSLNREVELLYRDKQGVRVYGMQLDQGDRFSCLSRSSKVQYSTEELPRGAGFRL